MPLELLVIPNAFSKMIPWNEAHALTIVPPAWSLGVEACFYLTVPLLALLSYGKSVILAYLLAAGHLIVLMIGSPIGRFVQCGGIIRENLCTIPISDYLGMDFPVFVGVTFLLGRISYLRFKGANKSDSHLAIIWAAYLFTFVIVGPYTGRIANLSTYDVLFAMCFLLPAALVTLELTRVRTQVGWDKLLGDLSYPLFLTHFLARYIVEYFFGTYDNNPQFYLQAIALSILLAAFLMRFQRGVDALRYAKRGFESARTEPKRTGGT
ncbi:peptidoglycan/LPS O-acetylase OafA/YrhL [Devosia sp. UYZn731]|uniref:acyltransferase family protein n=1 Tax=Devosia sp. UYZn731 TaxID=3156345 RepID=UPI00339648DE